MHRRSVRRLRRALVFPRVRRRAVRRADNSRQLTAEKMWALKRLGDPAITPDGRTAVVPVTTYDIKENKGLTDLWLVPVAGGAARQLTSDKASDTQPTVSPDGKWVAFVSKRGDDTESQVYVIAIDGGEARRVTNVPTGARRAEVVSRTASASRSSARCGPTSCAGKTRRRARRSARTRR